jgi:predicted Zn-dependent peptidase
MLRDQAVLLLCQPSPLNIYHPDIVPLKILNYICFDSLGSRLFELREQTGIFYTATGNWANKAYREHGFDFVGALLSVDLLEKGETLIRNLIDEIAKKGITQSELNAARQMYLKDLIDLVSTNDSIASSLGILESLELGFDYYDKVLHQVQTLTPDQLNGTCAKYFNTADMARIQVGRVGK